MDFKTKVINVVPYSPLWPQHFSAEQERLKKCLGDNCVVVHHIGSTSIPGLIAKDEIDIVCVVQNLVGLHVLESVGYMAKGEYNIPLRYYFSKRAKKVKINLHVCMLNHSFIDLNLAFRDYLRAHVRERDAYANLKKKILKSSTACEKKRGGFSNYNLQKNTFIKSILEKSNFSSYSVTICLHHDEVKAYQSLLSISQESLELQMADPHCYTLCLYHSVKIIGSCLIVLQNEKMESIKFAYDEQCDRAGASLYFEAFINEWLKSKNIYRVDP